MRYQLKAEPLMSDGVLIVADRQGLAMVVLVERSFREALVADIEHRLLSVAEATRGRVALSLGGVGDLSSAGINVLLKVNLRCRELGGMLAVFGLAGPVREMLEVTRLDRTLVIADDAESAARAFESGRGGWLARTLGLKKGAKRSAAA